MGKKIKEARRKRGLNRLSLAKKLGIPNSTLQGWELGKGEPTGTALIEIARVLEMDVRWFLGLRDIKEVVEEMRARESSPGWGAAPLPEVQFRIVDGPLKPGLLREEDYRAVPLVEGRIAAGPGRVVGEEVKEYALISAKEVPGRRGLIAVKVEGDSMLPVLQDQAIAVLDPGDKRITPRGMYGVRVEGGCTIKRVALGGKSLVLLPWNPEHAPEVVELAPGQSTEDLIIGRVVWAYQPFA